MQNRSKVFNFDDEALLLFEEIIVDPTIQSNHKTNPYSLISKKDGSVISVLDIHLPKRNAIQMQQTISASEMRGALIGFNSNMYYGQDFIIADISSDTLYLLTQNRKLTPLLTRKPSTHASSNPTTVWTPLLTTDKFVVIMKIQLDFSKTHTGMNPVFMYEFDTGEITEMRFADSHFRTGWAQALTPPAIDKNKAANLIWPSDIINAYKAKQLTGDIEKIAKTLDEDDNPVVRILKFK